MNLIYQALDACLCNIREKKRERERRRRRRKFVAQTERRDTIQLEALCKSAARRKRWGGEQGKRWREGGGRGGEGGREGEEEKKLELQPRPCPRGRLRTRTRRAGLPRRPAHPRSPLLFILFSFLPPSPTYINLSFAQEVDASKSPWKCDIGHQPSLSLSLSLSLCASISLSLSLCFSHMCPHSKCLPARCEKFLVSWTNIKNFKKAWRIEVKETGRGARVAREDASPSTWRCLLAVFWHRVPKERAGEQFIALSFVMICRCFFLYKNVVKIYI